MTNEKRSTEEALTSKEPVKPSVPRRILNHFKAFFAYLNEKFHAKHNVFFVFLVLNALALVELVRAIIAKRVDNIILSILVVVLLMLPSYIEKQAHVELPDVLEIIILLFIVAAEIFGEIESFYVKFSFWDDALHMLWGFLCAGIGYAFVDIMNRSTYSHVQLTAGFMVVFCVTFSLTIGVFWEIVEFSMDSIFGLDMQKDALVTSFGSVYLDETNSNIAVSVDNIVSTTITLADGETVVIEGGYLDIGIRDTMKDFIINFIGAVIFAVFACLYVMNLGKDTKVGRFVSHFIPTVYPRKSKRNGMDDEVKPALTPEIARNYAAMQEKLAAAEEAASAEQGQQ